MSTRPATVPLPRPKIVLHVEDSDDFAALVSRMLADSEYEVHHTRTLAEAEAAARDQSFVCAFVDLDLPDARGMQAVMGLRSASPELPLVVLSALPAETAPVRAVLLGAQDWVGKDEVSTDRLGRAASVAVARHDAQAKQVWRTAHDRLTGLPNRALAVDHLTRALGRANRRPTNVAVLFCDLDGLDAVNGTDGFEVGDGLLGQVAHALVAAVRPGDVVARWGGDEFLVIADAITDADQATTIAERIRESVAERVELPGAGRTVSLSIGIASSAGIGTPHELIAAADHAMLKAKRANAPVAHF